MNLFDGFLVALALVSVIAGAVRGFVREAAALAGWILAVVLVLNVSVGLGKRFPFDPGSAGARTAIAAILIVLACVLGASLVGRILRAALTAAQLGGPDRAMGALFGIVRALAVSLLIAVVVIHAGLSQSPFWKSSRLAPSLEAALRLISPELAPVVQWSRAAPGV
jgi:membrane protein required for colicin V production